MDCLWVQCVIWVVEGLNSKIIVASARNMKLIGLNNDMQRMAHFMQKANLLLYTWF